MADLTASDSQGREKAPLHTLFRRGLVFSPNMSVGVFVIGAILLYRAIRRLAHLGL
jgi:hypothetical protein